MTAFQSRKPGQKAVDSLGSPLGSCKLVVWLWQELCWTVWARCSFWALSFGSALKQAPPKQLWPLAKAALAAWLLICSVSLLSSFTLLQLLLAPCSATGEWGNQEVVGRWIFLGGLGQTGRLTVGGCRAGSEPGCGISAPQTAQCTLGRCHRGSRALQQGCGS